MCLIQRHISFHWQPQSKDTAPQRRCSKGGTWPKTNVRSVFVKRFCKGLWIVLEYQQRAPTTRCAL